MPNDVEAQRDAALAILLGSFLDGVPEASLAGADRVTRQAVRVASLGSIFLFSFQ